MCARGATTITLVLTLYRFSTEDADFSKFATNQSYIKWNYNVIYEFLAHDSERRISTCSLTISQILCGLVMATLELTKHESWVKFTLASIKKLICNF